jgi:hypothetical protein
VYNHRAAPLDALGLAWASRISADAWRGRARLLAAHLKTDVLDQNPKELAFPHDVQ